MNIGLDTTLINAPHGGGRYTIEMVRNLCRVFPDQRFFSFGPPSIQPLYYPNLTQINYREAKNLYSRLAYAVQMHTLLKRHDIDVFHNLTNYGIYNSPCPVVTTVLDLLTLKFPKLRGSYFQGILYRYYLPSLIKKAHHVISISKNTQRDLELCYGIRKNVTTIYLGYDRSIFHARHDQHASRILDKYGITPGYILFVGYLIPKKNIQVIIRAISILKDKYSLDPGLVIAGKQGRGEEEILHLVENLGLNKNVRKIGFVQDNDLGTIYRNAKIFVFPSLYEGFGLPVVEAMACGTPVLVSNSGSLPELVDNEKYMCSPSDQLEWSKKILKLYSNTDDHDAASNYCLNRASRFSWDECARHTYSIYREAASAAV